MIDVFRARDRIGNLNDFWAASRGETRHVLLLLPVMPPDPAKAHHFHGVQNFNACQEA